MYQISLQSGPKISPTVLSTCFGTTFWWPHLLQVSGTTVTSAASVCMFFSPFASVKLIRSLSPYNMSIWINNSTAPFKVEPAAILNEIEPRSRPSHLCTVTKLGRKAVGSVYVHILYSGMFYVPGCIDGLKIM